MSGKGARLKQVIIDRIRSGDYPVGYRLIGARSAALEFGVHSGTVSRVYRELANDGIVRTMHGSGTYVIAVPGPEHGEDALGKLSSSLKALAEQARQLGLSRDSWNNLATESADSAFLAGDSVIWMVECSRKDVDELSNSLTTLLQRSVNPVLVTEVSQKLIGCSPADVFLTTPFHYDEVAELMEERQSLLNVNVVPSSETLIRLAHVEPNASISVIASNEPTLERLVRMVHTYTRIKPSVAVLIDSPAAADVVRNAQVLVDSQSIHEQVMRWEPQGQVCTVRYQIEPTSVAYVREVLRRREDILSSVQALD